ncbi:hypothetical protein M569_15176, partial [Genlisea aurea]
QDSLILEQLKSKIDALALEIDGKTQEIKEKDNAIAAKENTIRLKSDRIVSLESEISAINNNRKLDASEQVKKERERSEELEKLVEKLKEGLNEKTIQKEFLEAKQTDAAKKTSELNSKLNSLQKIIDDQKAKLRKTERALQNAEEELKRAKLEAATKAKELLEAHGAWLPRWLSIHLKAYQSILEKNWEDHGKPGLEKLIEKAMEKKAQAEVWAAPHVKTVKTKWIPALKDQWVEISANVEPRVQAVIAKTVETYEASKDAVTPHIIKLKEQADPYLQEFRKISRPYIDQVAVAARPHVEKFRTTLKPYTQEAVVAYGKFLESASKYHTQVQDKVKEKLKSHELTRHIATKELIWFSASALLALPVIFLLKLSTVLFRKKATKPVRSSQSSRRKGKRVHSE